MMKNNLFLISFIFILIALSCTENHLTINSGNSEYILTADTIGSFFPILFKPINDYHTGTGKFSAYRERGNRKHAGVDLYTPLCTPIFAVADGTVIADQYYFLAGTEAIEIDHEYFIIRYAEVDSSATLVSMGQTVKAGQQIGWVGDLVRSGYSQNMLHLEKYSGTLEGSLSGYQYNNDFNRRPDLLDPTPSIDILIERDEPLAIPDNLPKIIHYPNRDNPRCKNYYYDRSDSTLKAKD